MDITYYDSGYIDQNYYVYTAEAVMGLGTFIVEDYLEPDYFENTGIAVTLTCEGTRLRIIEAAADLEVNFSQSVNGVIDVRAEVTLVTIANLSSQEIRVREFNSDLVTEFTQSSLASATFSPQVSFSSIASQLTAAFQNATGTITMDVVFTVSALVGVIKTATVGSIFSTGIDTSNGSYQLPGVFINEVPINPGFVMSFWAKRDTVTEGDYEMNMITPSSTPGTGVYQILQFRNKQTVLFGGSTRLDHAVGLFYPTDADEPYPYWQNSVPQDTLWHHYLIRMTEQASGGGGTATIYTLWRDGIEQTRSGFTNNRGRLEDTGGAKIGSGGTAGQYFSGANFDGAMAQVWMGTPSAFSVEQFYNNGPVDLTGVGGYRIYNLLNDPWTDVTASGTKSASSEPLYLGTNPVIFSLTAQPEAVLLVVANIEASSELAVIASKNVGISASITAESTVDVVNTRPRFVSADLDVVSSISVEPFVIRDDSATLTSATSLDCVNIRVRTGDVTATAETTLTATIGEVTQFNIALESQFTQETANSRTRDLVSALESSVTISIDAVRTVGVEAAVSSEFAVTVSIDRTRDHSVLLESAVTVSATYTRIPAISATLISEFAFAGEVEKFVVGQGVLAVVFTQTSQVSKVVFGSAALVMEAFELTQGDILNFDPCREIAVESETRLAKILPENRLLIVESETRALRVPQETRVLKVDYETRVNTIKC